MDKLNFFKYTTQDGGADIEVLLFADGAWLTQKNIATLFGVKVNTINYHIKRLKIKDKSTIRKFRIVQNEGGRKIEREVDFYNFDVIMFIGFRVNSDKAIQFRDWSVQASKRGLVKGFVPDDSFHSKSDNLSKTVVKDKATKTFFHHLKYLLTTILCGVGSFFRKGEI